MDYSSGSDALGAAYSRVVVLALHKHNLKTFTHKLTEKEQEEGPSYSAGWDISLNIE